MQNIDPLKIEQAFVPPDTPMFAELIARMAKDPELTPERQRDLISGLRRVARALGRAPEEVPADPKWLQPRLAKVMPAALGITPKAWQNALSDARSAMARAGIVKRRYKLVDDLTPPWRALWQAVLDAKDPTLPTALRRFVHFLSALEIAPQDVTQAHADAYLAALEADEISKSPQTAWRAAINCWNLAAQRIAGWPTITLSLPSRLKHYTRPDPDLPPALRADIDRLMQELASPDPFAEDATTRALRPQTLKQYTYRLKRIASEMLAAGVPAAQLQSVTALCEPARAEQALRTLAERRGNSSSGFIGSIAGLLRDIARREGLDEETQSRLADLARRAGVPPQKGMTRKNRDRLRVLQDERTLRRLLELPERLFTAATRATDYQRALAREEAVAIGILINCPLRVGNLAGLHLERHIQRPGEGRVFIVLAEEEVKNAQPLEFELPAEMRRILDRHVATRAPLLCPRCTPWLFPRRDGSGPIGPSELSMRIAKRIRKEIGVEMNAHLFRHLAAMIWLNANPGAYEAARRLLGHSEVSRTINLYSGLEARSAIAAYGRVLRETRGRQR